MNGAGIMFSPSKHKKLHRTEQIFGLWHPMKHHREEWSLDESAGGPGDVAHLRLHLPDARHATPKVDDFVWGDHYPKWESAWHGTLMVWCFFLRGMLRLPIFSVVLIHIIQHVFDWWLCLSLFVFFEEVSVSLTCTLTLGFLCLDQILGPKTCMLHMFSSQPSNSHVFPLPPTLIRSLFTRSKVGDTQIRGWSKSNALIGCDLCVDFN